jgi:hypothetical protein
MPMLSDPNIQNILHLSDNYHLPSMIEISAAGVCLVDEGKKV